MGSLNSSRGEREWGQEPGTATRAAAACKRSVALTAAQRVRAAQRHNVAVAQPHTVEHVAQVLRRGGCAAEERKAGGGAVQGGTLPIPLWICSPSQMQSTGPSQRPAQPPAPSPAHPRRRGRARRRRAGGRRGCSPPQTRRPAVESGWRNSVPVGRQERCMLGQSDRLNAWRWHGGGATTCISQQRPGAASCACTHLAAQAQGDEGAARLLDGHSGGQLDEVRPAQLRELLLNRGQQRQRQRQARVCVGCGAGGAAGSDEGCSSGVAPQRRCCRRVPAAASAQYALHASIHAAARPGGASRMGGRPPLETPPQALPMPPQALQAAGSQRERGTHWRRGSSRA